MTVLLYASAFISGFQFINLLKPRLCDYILCGSFFLFNLFLGVAIHIHLPGTDRCLICIYTPGYFLNNANIVTSGDKETNTYISIQTFKIV